MEKTLQHKFFDLLLLNLLRSNFSVLTSSKKLSYQYTKKGLTEKKS